jgi:hypothetical protein
MAKKSEVKMLAVREAASRIGAAVDSVRIWASKGRFPGARKEESPIGSYWIIPEDALKGFEMSKPGPKPGTKQKKKGNARSN